MTALAYVAWSYVLAALPAGKASNSLFLVPVVALILGWLVLGEIPAAVALIGGAITIFGLLIRGGVFERLPHHVRRTSWVALSRMRPSSPAEPR